MRKLIFADGTEIPCETAGVAPDAPGKLWIRTPITMSKAIKLFSSPSKTATMAFETTAETVAFEGFTQIFLIQQNGDGITVCMMKE